MFVQAKQAVKTLKPMGNSQIISCYKKIDIIKSKFGNENVICLFMSPKDARTERIPRNAGYEKSIIYLGRDGISDFFSPQCKLPVNWTFASIN